MRVCDTKIVIHSRDDDMKTAHHISVHVRAANIKIFYDSSEQLGLGQAKIATFYFILRNIVYTKVEQKVLKQISHKIFKFVSMSYIYILLF